MPRLFLAPDDSEAGPRRRDGLGLTSRVEGDPKAPLKIHSLSPLEVQYSEDRVQQIPDHSENVTRGRRAIEKSGNRA